MSNRPSWQSWRWPAEPQSKRRRHARYRYPVRAGIAIEVEGARSKFVVRPREISDGGLSFLHGGFLYPGSACTAILKTIDGEEVLVRGKIARCRVVRGRTHEVALRFDNPIDVKDFVNIGQHGVRPADVEPETASAIDYPPTKVIELAHRLQELAAERAPRPQLQRRVA